MTTPYNRSRENRYTDFLIKESAPPDAFEISAYIEEIRNSFNNPGFIKINKSFREEEGRAVETDVDRGEIVYYEKDRPKLVELRKKYIDFLHGILNSLPSVIAEESLFWTELFESGGIFCCIDQEYSQYSDSNQVASLLSLLPENVLKESGDDIMDKSNMCGFNITYAYESGTLSEEFVRANQDLFLKRLIQDGYFWLDSSITKVFDKTRLTFYINRAEGEEALSLIRFYEHVPHDIVVNWQTICTSGIKHILHSRNHYQREGEEAVLTMMNQKNYSLENLGIDHKILLDTITIDNFLFIKKANRGNLEPYITHEMLKLLYAKILSYDYRSYYTLHKFLQEGGFPPPREVGCEPPNDFYKGFDESSFSGHEGRVVLINQIYREEEAQKLIERDVVIKDFMEYVNVSETYRNFRVVYSFLQERNFVFEESEEVKIAFREKLIKKEGGIVEQGYNTLVSYLKDVDSEKKAVWRYLGNHNLHDALHFMPNLVRTFKEFVPKSGDDEATEEQEKKQEQFENHKKKVFKEILEKSGVSDSQHVIVKEILHSLQVAHKSTFSVLQHEHQANSDATPVFSEKNRGQLNLRDVLSELNLYENPELAELLRSFPEDGCRRQVFEELRHIRGLPISRLAQFLSEEERDVAQFFASRDGAGEDNLVDGLLTEVMPDIPANELRDLIIARNKERREKSLDNINSFAGHYRKEEWCKDGDTAKVEHFFNQLMRQVESGGNEDTVSDATDLLLNLSERKDIQDLGPAISTDVSESAAADFVGRVLPIYLENNEEVVKSNMFKEGKGGVTIMSRIIGEVQKEYAAELLVEAKKEVGLSEKEEKQARLGRKEKKVLKTIEGIQSVIEQSKEVLATVTQDINTAEQSEIGDNVAEHKRMVSRLKREQIGLRTKLSVLEKLLEAKKIQEKKAQEFSEKMAEFTEMNSQTMSSEKYLEFWKLLYAHGPRLKKDKNKMLLQEIQRLSDAEKGAPMFQDQHKFILAMSQDKNNTNAFMAALRLSLRDAQGIAISQFEGEWYRVELLPPSDASGYGMGNITDSCDAFGNGKKADFIKNPSTAQFVIRKSIGRKPTEDEWQNPDTVLSQSLATMTRDVFAPNEDEEGDPERRNKFLQTLIEGGDIGSAAQAAGFVTKEGKPDMRQFITAYTQANQTMCLDSVEGSDSSKEVVQKAIAVLSKEDRRFDGLRVTSGMQYSNIQGEDMVANTSLNETPLPYSDNYAPYNLEDTNRALLLQERKEERIQQERVGIRPANPQDAMIIAAIEYAAYTETGGSGYVAGYIPMYKDLFTSVTQSLYGDSLEGRSHNPMAFVDVVDKNGTNEINGYLIAYKRWYDDIYISDTSTLDKASQDGQRYRSGTKLLFALLENVATDPGLNKRRVTMECRGTTSALAIMKNKETLEGLTFADPENPDKILSYTINGPSVTEIQSGGDTLHAISFTIKR